MPLLLLDTSTERGFTAIVEGEDILFHAQLPFGMQNAQSLLPEIQRGLAKTGLSMDKIDLIGVGIGPGSYTGMRVGAMVAKTLAFALGQPLIGICSLDSFIPQQNGSFAAVIDAKISGVYIQTGIFSQGSAVELSGPALHPLLEAVRILQHVPVLVTPHAAQLRPKLEKAAGTSQWEWQETYPSPAEMARKVMKKFTRQEFSVDGRLDLLYLQKTRAEIEKEKRSLDLYDGS